MLTSILFTFMINLPPGILLRRRSYFETHISNRCFLRLTQRSRQWRNQNKWHQISYKHNWESSEKILIICEYMEVFISTTTFLIMEIHNNIAKLDLSLRIKYMPFNDSSSTELRYHNKYASAPAFHTILPLVNFSHTANQIFFIISLPLMTCYINPVRFMYIFYISIAICALWWANSQAKWQSTH